MRDSDRAWSKVVDHDESIVKAWRVESGDEREANGPKNVILKWKSSAKHIQAHTLSENG